MRQFLFREYLARYAEHWKHERPHWICHGFSYKPIASRYKQQTTPFGVHPMRSKAHRISQLKMPILLTSWGIWWLISPTYILNGTADSQACSLYCVGVSSVHYFAIQDSRMKPSVYKLWGGKDDWPLSYRRNYLDCRTAWVRLARIGWAVLHPPCAHLPWCPFPLWFPHYSHARHVCQPVVLDLRVPTSNEDIGTMYLIYILYFGVWSLCDCG